MSVNEQLAEWRHEGEWPWLRNLLEDEYRCEPVRLALRQSRVPLVSFKVDAELKQLLRL
jgi:hypothetical protein